MYRSNSSEREDIEEFKFPSTTKLSPDNRWMKLAQLVPWEEFEAEYAEHFSATQGAPAKPFRMALGALLIKERLGLSDEETVEQIRENPYLQHFVGLEEYRDQAPFDPSMMVHFRKRIPPDKVARINERIVVKALGGTRASTTGAKEAQDSEEPEPEPEQSSGSHKSPGRGFSNQGKLIIDASCAPADIRYPTDLHLLNDVREKLEGIIDELYEAIRADLARKPRSYRREARRVFLSFAKKRRPSAKQRRQGIRKQLSYIRRDFKHIESLLEAGACLGMLSQRNYRLFLVSTEVYRQQLEMYQQRKRRVDNRIVSLSQPHVRPIVRGKAGTPVEFGAKFSASLTQGFVLIDHLSWDNFNESGDLQQQAQSYCRRFGHYPQTIYADAIYRTRENRKWCAEHNIRLMGPPLGRPAESEKDRLAQQTREDERIRTQIEGKFGQGKRRLGLSRIKAKLDCTAATSIGICFLVLNLEYLLRQERSLFWSVFGKVLGQIRDLLEEENSPQSQKVELYFNLAI